MSRIAKAPRPPLGEGRTAKCSLEKYGVGEGGAPKEEENEEAGERKQEDEKGQECEDDGEWFGEGRVW